ncbi:unnamed protein product [Phaeothamnion confervicola]
MKASISAAVALLASCCAVQGFVAPLGRSVVGSVRPTQRFAKEQEFNDLNLEDMFEVFEKADKAVKDDKPAAAGKDEKPKTAGDAIADIMKLFGDKK